MGNSDLTLLDGLARSLARVGVGPDDRLLVAVSGGLDSMSLAHALIQLHATGVFAGLAIAHVNHQLRSEADGDENHVRDSANANSIPFYSLRVNTREEAERSKKGIEETARDLRYQFFEKCAMESHAKFVVTAHTANDQAETLIMNMMRGTGVRGLAGIPEVRTLGNVHLIRPWLDTSRSEIEGYAAAHGLSHRHDVSNDELIYTRNRVRHLVMPALKEAFPHRDPVVSLGRLAEHMAELEQFLSTMTREKLNILTIGQGLQLSGLRDLTGLPLKMLLEAWLERHVGYYRMSAEDSARVEAFLSSDSPAIELHGDLRLTKREDALMLADRSRYEFESQQLEVGHEVVTPYGSLRMSLRDGNEFSKDPKCAFFDADALPVRDLMIRSWKEGDRIAPLGMPGRTKLISDVLNEAGVSGDQKKNYPVVACAGEILWIPGIRGGEKAKITAKTQRMVVLEFEATH